MRIEKFGLSDHTCRSPFKRHKENIVLKTGCIWESGNWEIAFDEDIEENNNGSPPCSHCIDRHIHLHTTFYGDTYEKVRWLCPRTVVAWNEGGYNSTGVCLDCILEAAGKLDK